jgi:predicted nucleotidyltransferase
VAPALTETLAVLARCASRRGDLALIGAAARNAWAPPRATTDLDLAVAATDPVLASIEAGLRPLGYERVRSHRADPADPQADLIVYRASQGDLRQVDLLVAKTDFEREVLRRAVSVDIAGVVFPVATPEDLIVYKVIADRARDRDDIDAILRTQARAGRELDWAYVERWARFWDVYDRLLSLTGRGHR